MAEQSGAGPSESDARQHIYSIRWRCTWWRRRGSCRSRVPRTMRPSSVEGRRLRCLMFCIVPGLALAPFGRCIFPCVQRLVCECVRPPTCVPTVRTDCGHAYNTTVAAKRRARSPSLFRHNKRSGRVPCAAKYCKISLISKKHALLCKREIERPYM